MSLDRIKAPVSRLRAVDGRTDRHRDTLMVLARSLLFNGVFYLWSTALALIMLPALLGPPGLVASWSRIWHRGTRFWLRIICGIRIEIRGREFVPTEGALVAAKHQCSFDAVAPIGELTFPTIVAKQELSAIPFVAWIAARGRLTLSIDRGGHGKTLRYMLSEGKRALADGRQLVIYPEGTRAKIGAPPQYKSGVAGLYTQFRTTCVPVATNAGAHWLAGSFIRRPGVIVFQYLPPIQPGLTRGVFMTELEDRIETATRALIAEGL